MEPLIGLGKLARMAFAREDFGPIEIALKNRIAGNPMDANAWMDLSVVAHLTGNRDLGMSMQAQALSLKQCYHWEPPGGKVAVRLLAFMSPGDLSVNNTIEFLIEDQDISLDLAFVTPELSLASLPDHDIAMVAICESDTLRTQLAKTQSLTAVWHRPVINTAWLIASSSRDMASARLQGIPGVVMPISLRFERKRLEEKGIIEQPFPVIIRPVDSHKATGLAKLETAAELKEYLAERTEDLFYVTPFIDFQSRDGLYRKYRVVVIDGRPYASHMAISDKWVIHYVTAGMTTNEEKRAEEAAFMANFDNDFGHRHGSALSLVSERLGFEYVGFDCGETKDGDLLIFEADCGMTVHAMDPVDMFPYKRPIMHKLFCAFRDMLVRRGKENQ